ncbi:hypothetical protein AAFC00_006791 [Neodothiora populina]|uniref:BTB domain-containing protein n=1 Tax=Neodothiora populina TaxID=2781224 RepID=A0ABR3PBB6_9PEZI
MTSYLWKYYLEDDVDHFRHLLETAGYNVRNNAQKGGWKDTSLNTGMITGSPSAIQLGTSPTMNTKIRKASTPGPQFTTQSAPVVTLTRADINWRDNHGMTLLHHAVSSTRENSILFAQALIEHPLTDLYLQDTENGWTALHRAFYFGNITTARAILERDTSDALGQGRSGVVHNAGGLIKIKDREGHGPLDLFSVTIKDRTLRPEEEQTRRRLSNAGSEDDRLNEERGDADDDLRADLVIQTNNIAGDEVYTFGSNKNITLGFGDEDDRQYPERIILKRPDHLLQRFYSEYADAFEKTWASPSGYGGVSLPRNLSVESLPWVVRSKPLIIQDVFLSKLHTAVLTTDPESNLYMCGHGPGGRLGLGHERSQFNFACIEGAALAGKKIATVALGQNHTLALSEGGEVFSWGSNGFGQLGYSLPKSGLKDDEPINTVPRQIFGPLKREIVTGMAASRIHSVVHTTTSLYTFGKNEGQLGIIDSDARSLEIQVTPRKVAASLFSSSIASVEAIDRATICLLENHDVWVFANYGYTKMQFDLFSTTNPLFKESFLVTRYESTANHISKVTAGGDTICAMSSNGQIYTSSVSSSRPDAQSVNASTTNPTKIRGALSPPQRIWDPRRTNMAARDVGIDADGSIIISTEEGSVWQRSRRAKIRDSGSAGQKQKDHKFSRISGLTRVLAVRASAHGAYAAVRRDCDVTKTQVLAIGQTIWDDLFPLLCFNDLPTDEDEEDSDTEAPQPRFWQGRKKPDEVSQLCKQLLESKDPEKELEHHLAGLAVDDFADFDIVIRSTVSDALQFPAHQCILAGRSSVLRHGLQSMREGADFFIPDVLTCERDSNGRLVLLVQGIDNLSLVDFLLFCYTDNVVDFWHYTRRSPELAFRYRQIRLELIKLASRLDMQCLESAIRQMVTPARCLPMDMEHAVKDFGYLADGDIRVQLADDEVLVHSSLVCQRCPFFEGLFMGRAGGRWLDERRGLLQASDAVDVDLKHVESRIFRMVLRHIYADTGEELFDAVVSSDLDEFLDLVMEVMSVANELMLDRLSQVCQKVLGRFVTARNVCGLLNAIAPSSVTEFKDASLEYMCLSLEAMLQGGLLDELDEDILLELDDVVRDNQLACLPIARSGRAEADLLDRYPELAALMDRERRAKIDSIILHSKYQDVESWGPNSFRGQSFEEGFNSQSPLNQKRRKSSRGGLSPYLRGKSAVQEFGASIDEDEPLDLGQPVFRSPDADIERELGKGMAVGTPTGTWLNSKGKLTSPAIGTPTDEKLDSKGSWPTPATATPGSTAKTAPWAATPSPGSKIEMKDIMAQASTSWVSNLSLGIAASRAQENGGPTPAAGSATAISSSATAAPPSSFKMSQKERKKIQLAQQEQMAQAEKNVAINSTSPWQKVNKGPSLKEVMTNGSGSSSRAVSPKPSATKPVLGRPSTTPHLTMRQTIANPKPSIEAKAKSPLTQSPTPGSASGPVPTKANGTTSTTPVRPTATPAAVLDARPTSSSSTSKQSSFIKPLRQASIAAAISPSPPPDLSSKSFPNLIQSIRHAPKPVEPSLQLSMSEILSQQQLEKDIIREAREAKRNLQDIQAEQEFQEWWDRECQRVREEEEMARLISQGKDPLKEKKSGGGDGKRGGGGKRGGKGAAQQQQQQQQQQGSGSKGSHGGGRGGGRNGQQTTRGGSGPTSASKKKGGAGAASATAATATATTNSENA